MLYTVMPLERVYARPVSYTDIKQDKQDNAKNISTQEAEYREVSLQHGRIVTRREGENYIIERVHSTDMSDFLNDDYSPGKNIKS